MNKKTLANTPAVPASYETADVAAIQAMVRGEADPAQHGLALGPAPHLTATPGSIKKQLSILHLEDY